MEGEKGKKRWRVKARTKTDHSWTQDTGNPKLKGQVKRIQVVRGKKDIRRQFI